MKIKIFKVVGVLLLASILISGCSSKEDSISYNDTKKVKAKKVKEKVEEERVDKDLLQIQITDSNVDSSNLGKIDVNSYMNKMTSNVNGQSVTLTSIHFGFDNYLMRDEMLPIVKENSVKISQVIDSNSKIRIKLEGNCDEWGTDEYNFALGLKRTKTVRDALIIDGIKASSIVVVSLGESNPRCNDQTASCWKQNRRVDHLMLP